LTVTSQEQPAEQ